MPASYEQGYNARAKQSTRLLATGASITACTADLSQYATNLTAGTSVVYEGNTVRFNRGGRRTIGVDLRANSTDTGALYRHGTAGNTELLAFNAGSSIRVTVNNATALTYAVTGLDGTRDDLVVAWVTEENPDTTGASDAMISWLHVYNVTNGTHDMATFTHAAKNLQASTTAYWGATDSAGASAFTGTIEGIWFENRAQSGAEIAADWVAARSAVTGDVAAVHRGFPATADTIDQQDYHHGPSVLWAADTTRRLQYACFAPVWNEMLTAQPVWSDALLSGNAGIRGAPGASSWRMHRAWSRVVPVPVAATHLWCRVHLRIYVTSGSAVPLGVRVYSFSRRPSMAGAGPIVRYHVQATVSRDDTSTGVGEYTVLGLLPIARDTEGRTCVALAFDIDPSGTSANDANARFVVRAVHVSPVHYEPDGGLPQGGLAP